MSKAGVEHATATTLSPPSKFPRTPGLARATGGGRRRVEGCPHLTKSLLLAINKSEAGGSHFQFDNTYERLQRRTLIPPLPRKYHGHRSGNLHPPGLSKDLSHSHVPPLSLGSCEGYHLSTHPSFLFTSALVPNKRNTAVDYCQLNRPKVSHRTYNPSTIKDIQKVQGSYPDPMAGAPHSFLHRVSELSRMTEEAARQERLRRNSKSRKLEP